MNKTIIDNIDVSECKYLIENKRCKLLQHPTTGIYSKCQYVLCYYKKLKTAEADIEAYKESEQEAQEIIAELKANQCTFENCPNFERPGKQYADKISELEQEKALLKEEYEILENNFHTATRDCNERIEDLEQENARLKEEISQLGCPFYFKHTAICLGRKDDMQRYEKCTTHQNCNIKQMAQENKNYKQALQEIKKIISNKAIITYEICEILKKIAECEVSE